MANRKWRRREIDSCSHLLELLRARSATRIRASVGERSPDIWIGTFHAFGLELLRKYGIEIGLPVDLRLLDRSGSLMLLEELLPDLGLEHYLDLVDPLLKLRSILGLIARAKDELATQRAMRSSQPR